MVDSGFRVLGIVGVSGKNIVYVVFIDIIVGSGNFLDVF